MSTGAAGARRRCGIVLGALALVASCGATESPSRGEPRPSAVGQAADDRDIAATGEVDGEALDEERALADPSPSVATATAASATVRVFVVRHAEKVEEAPRGGDRDPRLSGRGRARADDLLRQLAGEPIDAILTTDLARTRETVDPLAQAHGLELTLMEPHDVGEVVALARSGTATALLVAGHSNTVPELLAALGVAEPVVLAEGDYGDLFVVTLEGDRATLERRRFGDYPP